MRCRPIAGSRRANNRARRAIARRARRLLAGLRAWRGARRRTQRQRRHLDRLAAHAGRHEAAGGLEVGDRRAGPTASRSARRAGRLPRALPRARLSYSGASARRAAESARALLDAHAVGLEAWIGANSDSPNSRQKISHCVSVTTRRRVAILGLEDVVDAPRGPAFTDIAAAPRGELVLRHVLRDEQRRRFKQRAGDALATPGRSRSRSAARMPSAANVPPRISITEEPARSGRSGRPVM